VNGNEFENAIANAVVEIYQERQLMQSMPLCALCLGGLQAGILSGARLRDSLATTPVHASAAAVFTFLPVTHPFWH